MDWARAKNILIFMLIALNLVLAATIVTRAVGGAADRDFYESVTDILKSRGVDMRCDFPNHVTNSGLLVYGDGARSVDNCARTLLASTEGAEIIMSGRESFHYTNTNPEENLNTVSATALDTSIRRTLAERGIDLSGFVTDYTVKTQGGDYFFQYIFNYQNNLVFDSKIGVTVDDTGGITNISLNYREIKAASPEKIMDIIPAYQILLMSFYEEAVIISIDIGFMGQNTARENPFMESEEGAVWRIRLNDGSERFFEATYGNEIFLNA